MGVQGLLGTCLENREACTDTYDLVQVAQQQGGLELIVDFYSFEHYILSKFWKGLSQLRGNDYLRILGGEYASLHNYVTKLVNDLKSQDIHLVFYIDAGKGSSFDTLRQKFNTWANRHEEDIKKMSQILDVLWGKTEISQLSTYTNIRPVVLEDQFMAALRSCGCEIHQSPAGEADLLIIRALRDRSKAFAILSNDSDFCVFKESRLIPQELFDIENDLQLGEPRELPEKPLRLNVKVISTENVMAMLKLNNHRLLVEMSIVAGNDFTGPYMRGGLHHKIDVRGRRCIQNFAGWIRHYHTADNHPYLADHIEMDPGFRQAVIHSRNFYNLRGEPDKCPQKGYFSQVIEEKIRSGQYPSNIMSMHNNFYWYRMLLEDNSYGAPCAECALTPLRAYLYRIVLPRQEQLVNEHGRSPYEHLRKAGVIAIDDGRAPPLHKIQPDKIFSNLRTFHLIWSHQERGEAVNWFERYGRKNGFIFYILRYFLLLNWQQNLHVTDNEFLALVAMVMGRSSEEHYQAIVIRPTVRCVTIGNWMQDVYRHGYHMFGSVLHIRHEFPLPSELFSGSVWTAMYMVCQDETFRIAAREVSPQVLYQTQQEMNAVIREKRHMIRHIVQDVFPFDDK
ncbi:uncharacterized protein LOC128246920 [Mya arenaria]|uniref:uncharacterized protein LOC128246920 n=1 Tax=Mya arenaria TaxID=6604 RepID=UPI0022E26277|nr:uncharacterized protein LOC128246920 [Mya arenaria]XP_052821423.1 uncharacterized protein LOC128246920 [Mya arenaria]XP_052821425.1 uncharacterized protein LOC128246920 [Mya arenaria]XP_052821426.1 uncharacterized protein LOC128246920 [Mya arenaria]XP_052821427.1 uncharacterized protein LOC128246920 [Mya arenaria]XP_052821428.1 uncharacterized protein LOC128246920 [Mya arenaria]